VTVLLGGIYELFQSDLDLGRLALERLRAEDLGPDVLIEDLHYGAVGVVQRLEELRPEALVLVSAVRRGLPAGSVQRRRIVPQPVHPKEFQAAIGDAVTGYVHIDLLLEVATGFDALPPRAVAVEVEPQRTESGEGLSEPAAAGLERALELVRAELRRLPLLALADQLRPLVTDERLEESASLASLRELLDELVHLDRGARWGRTFALRDRFRLDIAGQQSSHGMDHRDWGLWWALVEELDRLEAVEAVSG
jgi:Ni,Fe-hydrogenase maturation factor